MLSNVPNLAKLVLIIYAALPGALIVILILNNRSMHWLMQVMRLSTGASSALDACQLHIGTHYTGMESFPCHSEHCSAYNNEQ